MEETSSWAQGSAEPASTMGIPLRTVTFTRCRHTRGHVTVSLPPPPPPPAPRSPRRVCPEWWRWLRTASGAAPAAAARPAGWSPAPRTAWPLPALRSAPLPGASLSLRPAPLRPSSPPALLSCCPSGSARAARGHRDVLFQPRRISCMCGFWGRKGLPWEGR